MRRPIPTVVDDVLVGLGLVLLSVAGAFWIAPPGPVPTASANAPAGDGGWKPLIDGDPPIAWPCNAELDVAINLARVPEAQRLQLVDDIDAGLEHITAGSPYRLRRTYDLAVIPTEDTLADVAAAAGAEIVIAVDDSTQPDATDLLSPGAYGTGGLYYRGPHAYVGWVLLDVSALAGLAPGSGPRSHQALIIHELLHALGVGHTQHPTSIMQPALQSSTGRLADVDIAALARLNLGACRSRTSE